MHGIQLLLNTARNIRMLRGNEDYRRWLKTQRRRRLGLA